MERLTKLYKQYVGSEPTEIKLMDKAGSNRSYYRLSGEQSIVGVIGESREENDAFVYIARHFKAQGLSVPEVFGVSDDHMAYIQEDLGRKPENILWNKIRRSSITHAFTSDEKDLLKRSMSDLCDIQFRGTKGFDYNMCYPAKCFDERSIKWDLNYFKYCFLKATGIIFNEDLLENDFETLTNDLLAVPSDTFMYRDFQSRNVMLVGDADHPAQCRLAYIDFQGGRKGPYYYDVASFVWQSRAKYPDDLKKELVQAYLERLKNYVPQLDEARFHDNLRLFVLFRTLQVLGAYGFRGYFEKKPDFMKNSIVPAIANLRKLVADTSFEHYPYLSRVIDELVNLKDFTSDEKKLTVRVMSFAYKKGIPHDPSGNGGGFVFDCRALNNPGKYDKYKSFTGLDENVIRFLQKESTIDQWLEHVYALVDESVERYVKRNFTDLMVCFGCTGGQHRSVYAAQHMAEHIYKKFNVRVELTHREQSGHDRTFTPVVE
ncbi:MAG TPA: phosphotransferase [Porphyromonadaceae bacterium]|nr:phosphotransferase [Porphyromonadaceae bacterium]